MAIAEPETLESVLAEADADGATTAQKIPLVKFWQDEVMKDAETRFKPEEYEEHQQFAKFIDNEVSRELDPLIKANTENIISSHFGENIEARNHFVNKLNEHQSDFSSYDNSEHATLARRLTDSIFAAGKPAPTHPIRSVLADQKGNTLVDASIATDENGRARYARLMFPGQREPSEEPLVSNIANPLANLVYGAINAGTTSQGLAPTIGGDVIRFPKGFSGIEYLKEKKDKEISELRIEKEKEGVPAVVPYTYSRGEVNFIPAPKGVTNRLSQAMADRKALDNTEVSAVAQMEHNGANEYLKDAIKKKIELGDTRYAGVGQSFGEGVWQNTENTLSQMWQTTRAGVASTALLTRDIAEDVSGLARRGASSVTEFLIGKPIPESADPVRALNRLLSPMINQLEEVTKDSGAATRLADQLPTFSRLSIGYPELAKNLDKVTNAVAQGGAIAAQFALLGPTAGFTSAYLQGAGAKVAELTARADELRLKGDPESVASADWIEKNKHYIAMRAGWYEVLSEKMFAGHDPTRAVKNVGVRAALKELAVTIPGEGIEEMAVGVASSIDNYLSGITSYEGFMQEMSTVPEQGLLGMAGVAIPGGARAAAVSFMRKSGQQALTNAGVTPNMTPAQAAAAVRAAAANRAQATTTASSAVTQTLDGTPGDAGTIVVGQRTGRKQKTSQDYANLLTWTFRQALHEITETAAKVGGVEKVAVPLIRNIQGQEIEDAATIFRVLSSEGPPIQREQYYSADLEKKIRATPEFQKLTRVEQNKILADNLFSLHPKFRNMRRNGVAVGDSAGRTAMVSTDQLLRAIERKEVDPKLHYFYHDQSRIQDPRHAELLKLVPEDRWIGGGIGVPTRTKTIKGEGGVKTNIQVSSKGNEAVQLAKTGSGLKTTTIGGRDLFPKEPLAELDDVMSDPELTTETAERAIMVWDAETDSAKSISLKGKFLTPEGEKKLIKNLDAKYGRNNWILKKDDSLRGIGTIVPWVRGNLTHNRTRFNQPIPITQDHMYVAQERVQNPKAEYRVNVRVNKDGTINIIPLGIHGGTPNKRVTGMSPFMGVFENDPNVPNEQAMQGFAFENPFPLLALPVEVRNKIDELIRELEEETDLPSQTDTTYGLDIVVDESDNYRIVEMNPEDDEGLSGGLSEYTSVIDGMFAMMRKGHSGQALAVYAALLHAKGQEAIAAKILENAIARTNGTLEDIPDAQDLYDQGVFFSNPHKNSVTETAAADHASLTRYFDNYGDVGTVNDLLEHIASTTEPIDEDFRGLARAFLDAGKRVTNKGFQVRVAHDPNSSYMELGGDLYTQKKTENAVHESTHALTFHKIPTHLTFLRKGTTGKQYLKLLNDYLADKRGDKKLKKVIRDYIHAVNVEGTVQKFDDTPMVLSRNFFSGAGHYGLSSLHEFMAETVSDKEFANRLRAHPDPVVRNAFRRLLNSIMEWIKSVLMLPGSPAKTLFDRSWNDIMMFIASDDLPMEEWEKNARRRHANTSYAEWEMMPAGGHFVFGVPRLAATKNGKWLLDNKHHIGEDGMLTEDAFHKLSKVKKAEIEFYRVLIPQAFDNGKINVPVLYAELKNFEKALRVDMYGGEKPRARGTIGGDALYLAQSELADLTHNWLENLSEPEGAEVSRVFSVLDSEYPPDSLSFDKIKTVNREISVFNRHHSLIDFKAKEDASGKIVFNAHLQDNTVTEDLRGKRFNSTMEAAEYLEQVGYIPRNHINPTDVENIVKMHNLQTIIRREEPNNPTLWPSSAYGEVSPFDTTKYPVRRIDVSLEGSLDQTTQEWGPLLWQQDNMHENMPNTLVWAMVQIVPHPVTGEDVMFIGEFQSRWAQQRRKAAESYTIRKEGRSFMVYNRHGNLIASSPKIEEAQRAIDDSVNANVPDHPLLKHHQQLGLKAVISKAQEMGIRKIAISTPVTAMMTQGHDAVGGDVGRYRVKWLYGGEETSDIFLTEAAAKEKVRELERSAELFKGSPSAGMAKKAEISNPSYELIGPRQERGMTLAYGQTLPSIVRSITGERGTEVDFGVHKRALRRYYRGERFAEGLIPEGEHNVEIAVGSDFFKTTEGKPVTQATARVFSIEAAPQQKIKSLVAYSNPLKNTVRIDGHKINVEHLTKAEQKELTAANAANPKMPSVVRNEILTRLKKAAEEREFQLLKEAWPNAYDPTKNFTLDKDGETQIPRFKGFTTLENAEMVLIDYLAENPDEVTKTSILSPKTDDKADQLKELVQQAVSYFQELNTKINDKSLKAFLNHPEEVQLDVLQVIDHILSRGDPKNLTNRQLTGFNLAIKNFLSSDGYNIRGFAIYKDQLYIGQETSRLGDVKRALRGQGVRKPFGAPIDDWRRNLSGKHQTKTGTSLADWVTEMLAIFNRPETRKVFAAMMAPFMVGIHKYKHTLNELRDDYNSRLRALGETTKLNDVRIGLVAILTQFDQAGDPLAQIQDMVGQVDRSISRKESIPSVLEGSDIKFGPFRRDAPIERRAWNEIVGPILANIFSGTMSHTDIIQAIEESLTIQEQEILKLIREPGSRFYHMLDAINQLARGDGLENWLNYFKRVQIDLNNEEMTRHWGADAIQSADSILQPRKGLAKGKAFILDFRPAFQWQLNETAYELNTGVARVKLFELLKSDAFGVLMDEADESRPRTQRMQAQIGGTHANIKNPEIQFGTVAGLGVEAFRLLIVKDLVTGRAVANQLIPFFNIYFAHPTITADVAHAFMFDTVSRTAAVQKRNANEWLRVHVPDLHARLSGWDNMVEAFQRRDRFKATGNTSTQIGKIFEQMHVAGSRLMHGAKTFVTSPWLGQIGLTITNGLSEVFSAKNVFFTLYISKLIENGTVRDAQDFFSRTDPPFDPVAMTETQIEFDAYVLMPLSPEYRSEMTQRNSRSKILLNLSTNALGRTGVQQSIKSVTGLRDMISASMELARPRGRNAANARFLMDSTLNVVRQMMNLALYHGIRNLYNITMGSMVTAAYYVVESKLIGDDEDRKKWWRRLMALERVNKERQWAFSKEQMQVDAAFFGVPFPGLIQNNIGREIVTEALRYIYLDARTAQDFKIELDAQRKNRNEKVALLKKEVKSGFIGENRIKELNESIEILEYYITLNEKLRDEKVQYFNRAVKGMVQASTSITDVASDKELYKARQWMPDWLENHLFTDKERTDAQRKEMDDVENNMAWFGLSAFLNMPTEKDIHSHLNMFAPSTKAADQVIREFATEKMNNAEKALEKAEERTRRFQR